MMSNIPVPVVVESESHVYVSVYLVFSRNLQYACLIIIIVHYAKAATEIQYIYNKQYKIQ